MKSFLLFCCLVLNLMIFGQSLKQEFSDALATNNEVLQKKIAINLHKTYSNFTYDYFEILLNHLPKNATLITNASDDTFPIKILQLTKDVRSDVEIVSIKMLKDSNYIKTINKSLKLDLMVMSPPTQVQKILEANKNTFFSSTVNSSYWYRSNYYLAGLYVQKGSSKSTRRLQEFYNSVKKLELKSYQLTGFEKALIKNVLPPLITLYKNGNQPNSLREDILKIADLIGNKKVVLNILDSD